MKKSYIWDWRDCQYMNGNRFELGLQMYNFEAMRGIPVRYEHQVYNGNGSNWLWFGTNDNNGEGMYIEVKGPKDATTELYIINMHMNNKV